MRAARCPICGDVIGVYEPVFVEHADGTTTRSSLLNLDPQERAGAAALYHAACVDTRDPAS
jgi:hypothetical protein